MKEETKKNINWALEHFNHYKIRIHIKPKDYGLGPKGVEQESKFTSDFINFLHTLPEIESHLCRGGYIQDKNGTPCCDGDKVILNLGFGNKEGILRWDNLQGSFAIWIDNDGIERPFTFVRDIFEKVEK